MEKYQNVDIKKNTKIIKKIIKNLIEKFKNFSISYFIDKKLDFL